MAGKKIEKHISLEKLIRNKNGGICWSDNIGKIVDFKYGDISGTIQLISYDAKNESVCVLLGNNTYSIKTKDLKRCALGTVLGVYGKYKFNIGEINNGLEVIGYVFKNGKSHYTVKCIIDGYVYDTKKSNFENGYGCPVCANRVVIKGINDIATTNPDIVKYIKDINDAYLNSKSNSNIITFICPVCKNEKEMRVNTFYRYGIMCNCSDSISYPNKFIVKLLNELNVEHKTEKTFEWSCRKRYDCYIESLECIIENHGMQHYNPAFVSVNGRTLKEERYNDKLKRELASDNGIKHYIELDCRKSEMKWIKNSIMSSELPKLLNFKEEDVDWLKCHEFSIGNIVMDVCNLWNKGFSVKEICNSLNISNTTVRRYLNIGTKNFGIANYDGEVENRRCRSKMIIHNETGIIYESMTDAARKLKMSKSVVIDTVNHNRNNNNGYTFTVIQN